MSLVLHQKSSILMKLVRAAFAIGVVNQTYKIMFILNKTAPIKQYEKVKFPVVADL
jgi:hypothetical protein